MLHNFLSRPLSFLGWTTAMLFWLDFHQTQSNLSKWFRTQRHDWSSTSPKEPMLHLSLSPCTGSRLQLASSSRHWCLYRTTTGSALLPLTITNLHPSRSLRSASERRLVVSSQRETQNHFPECFHSPFLAGGMIFPPLSGMLIPWQLKNFFSFLLFPRLACTFLNNAWNLLLRALSVSICLFKMNRLIYSPIVSHFG